MKKILLLIGLVIWANLNFAQVGDGTATITIGSVNDPVPGPVVVPVTLDAISHPTPFGDELISGFALYFYYDASVLVGIPTIVMDSYWTTQGSYVTNTIINQPSTGYNTIALVWATGGQVSGVAPQNIANITFNYDSGSTNLMWTTAKSMVEIDGEKTISYVVDYDGYDYQLTTNPGCVCTSGYDITFQVEDENSNPLQDAMVTIGSESILTDATGMAVFNRPDGEYDYSITIAGYNDVSSSVTVAGSSLTVPVTMYPLGSLFDVTFHVTDGTNNLAGASVTVGTQTKVTDANGMTVFARPNGDYNYSVSKYGFTPGTGTFTVASAVQTVDVVLTMLPHFDITFHVTSGGNNVEGASIAITGVGTMLTDMDGNAVFSLIDGDYNYTITKAGYAVKTGTTTVAGSPFTVEETLVPIYAITIHVSSEGTNLQGATVTVGTQSVVTNANGNAVFNRADGNYSYTVTLAGYNTATGDFIVNGAPATIEVEMELIEYEVTFHVIAEGNDLEGVLISIDNGASGTTDVDGITIIELPTGDFVYTATKDGYGTVQELVTVSGGPVSVEITMVPDPTYAVTFQVTAVGGANIDGAQVTVGSEIILTNASGVAVFNLENGTYSYTVTKLGYVDQSGTFLVINAPKTVPVVMPLFAWATTFHVVSEGADLVGAEVTVNPGDLSAFTGATGNAVLNIVNGTYTYTVEKAGYITATGDLVVDNAAQTVEVDLSPSPWQVTFHIVSVGGALEEVAVTCNGETIMTDASGNAVFSLPNGTYDYECVKDGYITLSAPPSPPITVNGANLIKNLIMFPDTWAVTFNVTSSGAPVEGALVSAGGEEATTPASGTVVLQLANGSYTYTVEHPEFETQTGPVNVNNANTTVNVVLTVGIGNINASSFSIYPNPSNGVFHLTTTAAIGSESDIAVYDTEGKLVYSGKLEGNEVEVIELSNQDKGMYILRILVGDKVFNKTLINK